MNTTILTLQRRCPACGNFIENGPGSCPSCGAQAPFPAAKDFRISRPAMENPGPSAAVVEALREFRCEEVRRLARDAAPKLAGRRAPLIQRLLEWTVLRPTAI
jgi:hypothetical protein